MKVLGSVHRVMLYQLSIVQVMGSFKSRSRLRFFLGFLCNYLILYLQVHTLLSLQPHFVSLREFPGKSTGFPARLV